jgi:hypothetical protein
VINSAIIALTLPFSACAAFGQCPNATRRLEGKRPGVYSTRPGVRNGNSR